MNLKITMKEVKSIKTEMNDLKKSVEFTGNVLEEKVQKFYDKAEYLDEQIREIYEWQLDPEYVHNKLEDLEDRSARNNVIKKLKTSLKTFSLICSEKEL